MNGNSNYPLGVDGTHDYFNEPDPPECPRCYTTLEADWNYCPSCGESIDWEQLMNGGVDDDAL